ncbi:MAG: Wzz/FepE/Etk N-terminal domain-containing protein [Actinophytocola sp.]|uniref:Wzz/FepE/Etk N-terminal domain-containing protein n=1 Tax=Actinophytocola sp. TaxID=1872138 RepID=UPI003C7678DA
MTNNTATNNTATKRTAPRHTAAAAPQHLLDFARLWAGIRRRRGLWLAFALIGFLAGGMLAVLMPPPPSAVTRILVVHEEDSPSDGGSLIRTDVTLMTTTRIAAAALKTLGSNERPEEFLKQYEVVGVTNNVLEVTATGATGAEAARRAKALADAFIADHVGRIQAGAEAEAAAIVEQRNQVQADLDAVNGEISGAEAAAALGAQNNPEGTAPPQPNAAGLDSFYARRAELTDRITQLTQQAQEAGLGAPRAAAGTQVVDAPRPVRTSLKITGATNAGIGLVLGLVLGLTFAAVTGAVKDKPVLRRDIAENLGASVIAQLPPRRRGLARLLPNKKAVRQRDRVAATLVRLVRDGSGPVSVLELGAANTASGLATAVARELSADRAVALVGDPARITEAPTGTEHPVRLVDVADTSRPVPGEARLGVGSVAPGATWTDLPHLGNEALLVVRAGYANTAWLHVVARQLADIGIPVVGVVLVDPDPRDKTDGTLWDGLHTALRGRAKHAGRKTNGTNGTAVTNGSDLPTKRLTPVQPPARKPATTASTTAAHDLPTKKFAPVRRETEELTQRRTQG